MEALRTALKLFVNHVTQSAGIYTSVIVIFVYHVVLHKDLPCTCSEQHRVCWLYMVMPACVIFIFVLWVDKTFQTALTNICCAGYECQFLCVAVNCIVRAACIGSLWAVAVLMDGDWYICCHNNEAAHQELACKERSTITAEEQRIRNKLVGKSMIWGLPMLLGFVLLAAISSSIQACCKKKNHQIPMEEDKKLVTGDKTKRDSKREGDGEIE